MLSLNYLPSIFPSSIVYRLFLHIIIYLSSIIYKPIIQLLSHTVFLSYIIHLSSCCQLCLNSVICLYMYINPPSIFYLLCISHIYTSHLPIQYLPSIYHLSIYHLPLIFYGLYLTLYITFLVDWYLSSSYALWSSHPTFSMSQFTSTIYPLTNLYLSFSYYLLAIIYHLPILSLHSVYHLYLSYPVSNFHLSLLKYLYCILL